RHELSLAPDEYAGFVMTCLRMLALLPADRIVPPVSDAPASSRTDPDPEPVKSSSPPVPSETTPPAPPAAAEPVPKPDPEPVPASGPAQPSVSEPVAAAPSALVPEPGPLASREPPLASGPDAEEPPAWEADEPEYRDEDDSGM